MLARNLLYFAYLTLFANHYFLADSLNENQKKISNSLTLIEKTKGNNILNPKSDELILADFTFDRKSSNNLIDRDSFNVNKISESNRNSLIYLEDENVNRYIDKSLKWQLIETENTIPSDIKWLPIDLKDHPELDINKNNKRNTNLYEIDEKKFDFKFLKLGRVLSTAETLSEGEIRFNFGQVSPVSSGYAKGTGNQNYLGEIDYGFNDNFLLSIFYTDADDPLTKRIVKLDTQPENRWSSYGGSFKWKFLERSKYEIAIEGSLENWMVQSGGCSSTQCSTNSSNIFNSQTSMVENNNLVGSVSLPIGINHFPKYDFTITPKLAFLPESQSNQYGKGDFYGNNYGIGFGIAYKPIDRLKTFTSYYVPLGDSSNSFDYQLNFSKTSIYTLGINYLIDARTNFQAFLSNGFGLSPATSVLTIPSSDEILYGFNIIYTPTKLDNFYHLNNEKVSNSKSFNGLTVSNNSLIDSEDSQLNIFYDLNGSWNSRYEKALSQRFSIDIISGVIDKNVDTNSNLKSYFSPGNTILRGGAKAILYSNEKSNIFTSSLRGSFGRVLAESKPGYFFGESINSYNFDEKVSFNVNPKIGVSGSGESIGLGTGVHWKVLNEITLISETNIPINNAENNMTFAIRYSPEESYKHIDLYSSNAFSFIDMGQLMKRDKNILGVNAGILF